MFHISIDGYSRILCQSINFRRKKSTSDRCRLLCWQNNSSLAAKLHLSHTINKLQLNDKGSRCDCRMVCAWEGLSKRGGGADLGMQYFRSDFFSFSGSCINGKESSLIPA